MKNLQNLLEKNNVEFNNLVEEWKPIIGFKRVVDNLYEVSNYGEVRDIITKKVRHKKLATKLYHSYYAVSLKHNNDKLEWVLVHQLVAHFFINVPDELKEFIGTNNLVVDHKDNNGLNNIVTNLQWTTRGENRRLSGIRHDDIHLNGREKNLNFSLLHNICVKLAENKPFKNILDECSMDYNPNNIKFLRSIGRKTAKINVDKIIDSYNIKMDEKITKNSSRPTPLQNEIVINLPTIRNLISLGRTNSEIVDEIWPDLKNTTREGRIRTVRKIRYGEIYRPD